MRGDMIETFKILKGVYDGKVTSGLFKLAENSTTRGNSLKISKQRCARDIRKYCFTSRVVDIWNSLPECIVTSKSVHQFENRLDKHWERHPMRFDYTADYKPHSDANRGTFISDGDTVEPQQELPIEDLAVLQAERT